MPTPEAGESPDDFLDRCTQTLLEEGESNDPDEALAQCEAIWDAKAKRGAVHKTRSRVVHKIHVDKAKVGTEFILSDQTVDRMGDVILASGWRLDNFRRNPVCLFGHRNDFPVGRWADLRVEGKALVGRLELAPAGLSGRIDEIRALVEAGILTAVSVGFTPVETRPREDGGTLFVNQELLEASLVSVPANPNCLQIAKQLKISSATQRIVFAKPAAPNALQVAELKFDKAVRVFNAACEVVARLQATERNLAAAPYVHDLRDEHMQAVKSVRRQLSMARGRVTLARLDLHDADDAVERLLGRLR